MASMRHGRPEFGMITLFAVPKPMQGEFARLQENAVGSWRALGPGVEILLLGDEPGLPALAEKFHARHIRDVARTDYGTPRVDDIFRIGTREAANNLLCYINADIILTQDFHAALSAVAGWKRRFLMVGRRWDLDVNDLLDFVSPDWERKIRQQTEAEGSLHANRKSIILSTRVVCGMKFRPSRSAARGGITG